MILRMTAQKKDDIRMYFSAATFIFIIGVFVQQIRWQERTDARIEKLEIHQGDRDQHPTYQERARNFIPRNELENRLDAFEVNQEKMNTKLDKIIERI